MIIGRSFYLVVLNEDGSPSEHQLRLIESLQTKIVGKTIPRPQLNVVNKISNLQLSGRGTFEDHIRILSNYICPCGSKIGGLDHSTSSESEDIAFDIYKMKCNQCGESNEISFHSLRKTLLQESNYKYTQDKIKFPYL